MKRTAPPVIPEIPIAETGDRRVLLGCSFTLAQVEALKDGVVPDEVSQFFQKAYETLTADRSPTDFS